jgi:alpha-galactosidase
VSHRAGFLFNTKKRSSIHFVRKQVIAKRLFIVKKPDPAGVSPSWFAYYFDSKVVDGLA